MMILQEKKNLLFLWVEKLLIGSKLQLEDNTWKQVLNILDYDAVTHVFRIEFTDGDILTLPDKDRYVVDIISNEKNIERKPNKVRNKFKR